MVDLVLDGAGLIAAHFGAGGTAVAVERLDHHALRSFDVAEDLRDREAPFLGDLDLGAALDDHGVDEHQRGRVLLAHVHDRDALRDADLVGGEPHALGGAHRFEQVVHEPPHGVVHAGHGRRALAQHRRAEQVEAADGHDAFASTARLTMLAMLPRRTTSLASPLRIALQRLQQLLMLLLLAALRPENQEVQEPEDQAELQEQQPHPGAGVARWGEQQREQALNDHGVSP